jgi:hypothetical protein
MPTLSGINELPMIARQAPHRRELSFPILRRVPPNTKSLVVGDLTMTSHRVENGRRNFLLTIASGIAGLAAGSWPARVLAQSTGDLSISTIGAGREGGALGALFVKAGHLYERANGYSYDAVKIFMPAGAKKPVYAPYVEHMPPDVTACIFWMKNRMPERWRDVQNVEHVLGKYIISDKPMTEEQWARERATVIDADVTPAIPQDRVNTTETQ